jgi:hypothetical protein
MIDILGHRQAAEVFNSYRIPAGGISYDLIYHGEGALAPPHSDGVCHLSPGAQTLACCHVKATAADQIADVGNRPLRTGFNKEIVIKPGIVLLQNAHLLCNNLQQISERISLIDIPDLVDIRKKVKKMIDIKAQDITPSDSNG